MRTADEISRESPVLSTHMAAMIVSRPKPRASSCAAKMARSMKERSLRSLFS
jgi:hypothetical protein